jgi:cytochrome c-type biogenesis protein CcmH/NrfF
VRSAEAEQASPNISSQECRTVMKRSVFSGVLLLVLLPLVGAGAQEPPRLDEPIQPHPEGEAAIHQLRSPYCPGLMLEVCPSTQAKLLRDSLQMLAWEGAPADSIVGWMLANHGEEYRAVPQARGSGLWAWVMPPLALVAGVILVSLVLRHLKARGEEQPATIEELSEEDESELEAALEELKASEEVPF